MSALPALFERLRREHHRALIPFLVGGYPRMILTPQLLLTLDDAGADVIEVGIPFSDPLADGPVIQAASARALAAGATPQRILEAIAGVRHRLSAAVVCLSYWNPILQFNGAGRGATSGGPDAFVRMAAACGLAGMIVPDLPVEEGGGLRRAAQRAGVCAIFLAAPTSPPARLRAIAEACDGFIYYVSVMGTTGVRHTLPHGLMHGVRQLRLVTTKPICVGFGISTVRQAAQVARIADGVIIGSALIRAIGQAGDRASVLRAATTFLTPLRHAVR